MHVVKYIPIIKRKFDQLFRPTVAVLGFVITIFMLCFTDEFLKYKDKFQDISGIIQLLYDYSFGIILSSAILIALLSIIHWRWIAPSISNLETILQKEREKNKIIANIINVIFEGFLFNLATGKLNIGTTCLRLALYLHDGVDKFIPFSRYSKNPYYYSPGRASYPENEGVLFLAWTEKWHYDLKPARQKYDQYNNEKYNIPIEVLQAIKMKSCFYAAMRIDDTRGHPLAVILIESTDKKIKLNENDLKQKLEQEHGFLADLIINFREYIPMPNYAKSRGL